MKLSIASLLSIPTLSPANAAFCEVLGSDVRNPDFEITQDNADAVAAWLDRQHAAIPHIGQPTLFLDAQTPESYMDDCRNWEKAFFAAKEVFRVCGLSTPEAWCEPAS